MSSAVARPADDPAVEYGDFAAEIADQIESFLLAVREIARGADPGSTLSLLLLEVSQLCLAGGRLGAISDVVPDERFEPDAGPDADVDELRLRIAALLEPVDGYVEVVDPVDPERGATGFRLSDDLASIAQDLLHGLSHYKDGRVIEALWWWQFSYLSSWGSTAGAALRALHSLIAHTRLDHHDEQIEVAQEALLPVEAEL
ncbi:DUF5063 domain-containing protein [Jiangella rhizosphaerae]|uniref:DUF5063 domain-containing protein n=1 Tax=Jiangella rhizosphaerae TaxID=2293569 RepID=A0A418KP34_9ACTN|nr:DUF5063 domain-containing protein [Jiangella rhizosphaerae]RIQ21040.1 DUF5063 domain-containing protein [Jiangella rhizosphaerae]